MGRHGQGFQAEHTRAEAVSERGLHAQGSGGPCWQSSASRGDEEQSRAKGSRIVRPLVSFQTWSSQHTRVIPGRCETRLGLESGQREQALAMVQVRGHGDLGRSKGGRSVQVENEAVGFAGNTTEGGGRRNQGQLFWGPKSVRMSVPFTGKMRRWGQGHWYLVR